MVENDSLLVVEEIPPDNIYTSRFIEHFTQAPCRCCGSLELGLLKWTVDQDNKNILEYSCPISLHQYDLSHLDMTNIVILTHLACPEKMAAYHKYRFTDIYEALRLYSSNGAGRWMTNAELDTFKKSVYKRHIHHHQGKNADKRHKILFFPSCRICGQPDHPMLRPYINEDGSITYHYSCPVAACDDWHEAHKDEDKSKKYSLCTHKFAQVNNYSYNKIQDALETCRVDGTGKFLDTETFRILRRDIIHICALKHQEDQPKKLGLLAHIMIVIISIILLVGINLTLTQRGSQL